VNKNQKWEEFAQKIVEGVAQTEAYRKIYKCKKKSTAEQNASKLLENTKFGQVLQRYQDEVKEKHEGLAEQTINELKAVAFSDITEIADVTRELDINLRADKLSDLPPEIRRTIQSFDINRTSGGSGENPFERVLFKFKMHDKMAALNTLTKILGITKDDDGDRENKFTGMSNQEIWLYIVRRLQEMAALRGKTIIPMKMITDAKNSRKIKTGR